MSLNSPAAAAVAAVAAVLASTASSTASTTVAASVAAATAFAVYPAAAVKAVDQQPLSSPLLPPPPPPPCRKERQGVVGQLVGQQPWEAHQPLIRTSKGKVLQVVVCVVLVYVQCLRFVFT